MDDERTNRRCRSLTPGHWPPYLDYDLKFSTSYNIRHLHCTVKKKWIRNYTSAPWLTLTPLLHHISYWTGAGSALHLPGEFRRGNQFLLRLLSHILNITLEKLSNSLVFRSHAGRGSLLSGEKPYTRIDHLVVSSKFEIFRQTTVKRFACFPFSFFGRVLHSSPCWLHEKADSNVRLKT